MQINCYALVHVNTYMHNFGVTDSVETVVANYEYEIQTLTLKIVTILAIITFVHGINAKRLILHFEQHTQLNNSYSSPFFLTKSPTSHGQLNTTEHNINSPRRTILRKQQIIMDREYWPVSSSNLKRINYFQSLPTGRTKLTTHSLLTEGFILQLYMMNICVNLGLFLSTIHSRVFAFNILTNESAANGNIFWNIWIHNYKRWM